MKTSTLYYNEEAKISTQINEVVLLAGDKLSDFFYSNNLYYDLLLLYSMICTNDKSGLSPLHLTNIFNYVIGNSGKLQKIKTKAWEKSRKRINNIQRLLKTEIKIIIKENPKYLFLAERYNI